MVISEHCRPLSSLNRSELHETFCDFSRHFATKQDRKRRVKSSFQSQNSKRGLKHKQTRTIGGYSLSKRKSVKNSKGAKNKNEPNSIQFRLHASLFNSRIIQNVDSSFIYVIYKKMNMSLTKQGVQVNVN